MKRTFASGPPRLWLRGLAISCLAFCVFVPTLAFALDAPAPLSLPEVIEQVQPKIVKIYGAGGLPGLAAYQSGVLISAEGHVLTAWSHVLDADSVAVVLNDGRRLQAKLLGAEPRLEVAVLKIDGKDLPHFDLAHAAPADAGTRILAVSNAFNVAMGNEAASVQRGTIAVKTTLAARRGAFETPYHGPVYVLDVTTNNSGAAGGALVTRHGELLGILGKELRNVLNNTWLNYAVPIDQLREPVEAIRSGKYVARRDDQPQKKPAHAIDLAALGILLVPDVVERTPPYVDSVRPDSPAARAGVRPDDLLLLVGDHLVSSCKAAVAELEYIDTADRVRLTLLRGQDLVEVNLQP